MIDGVSVSVFLGLKSTDTPERFLKIWYILVELEILYDNISKYLRIHRKY